MPFQILKTSDKISSNIFPTGIDKQKNTYHNIGSLSTPYDKKPFSSMGDYGPPQSTVYYTDTNNNYPYVLDKNSISSIYIPTKKCEVNHPEYIKSEYPGRFVPSNYFSPQIYNAYGHTNSLNKKESFLFENNNYINLANAYSSEPKVNEYSHRFTKNKW
jgi:hypothetical protein